MEPIQDYIEKQLLPYLTDDIRGGISVETFRRMVRQEQLDQIPDGDGYGGYREIRLYPSRVEGYAWTEVLTKENGRFVLTSTGERGGRGHSCAFEEESVALAHFVARLRALKAQK